MPITPQFQLSQTDTHLLIHVVIQHIRVTSVQIAVTTYDHHQLVLLAAPPIYTLRLPFPLDTLAPLEEEEEEIVLSSASSSSAAAAWNHSDQDDDGTTAAAAKAMLIDGKVTLRLRKQHPGVHLDDVDLWGKVAKTVPKKTTTSRWLQQIVDTTTSTAPDHDDDDGPKEQPSRRGLYGFGRLFSNIFTDANRDGLAKEMLELPWHDDKGGGVALGMESLHEIHATRRLRRLELERSTFDPDRYLGDWMGAADDPIFTCAMEYSPAWLLPSSEPCRLTEGEQAELAQIPYPLITTTSAPPERLVLALLDILFAFVYDHVFTTGDPTVESAWTISTVSATLATLEDWTDVVVDTTSTGGNVVASTVVYSSLRRSLIYPYLRHCDLGFRTWTLVAQMLRRDGRRGAVRCLLHTRKILHASELYYLGNTLFVDPYLAWLQVQQPPSSSSSGHQEHPIDAVLRQAADAIEVTLARSPNCIKQELGLDLLGWEAMTAEDGSSNGSATTTDSDDDSTAASEKESSDDESSAAAAQEEQLSNDLLNLKLEDKDSLFCVQDGTTRTVEYVPTATTRPLVEVITSRTSLEPTD